MGKTLKDDLINGSIEGRKYIDSSKKIYEARNLAVWTFHQSSPHPDIPYINLQIRNAEGKLKNVGLADHLMDSRAEEYQLVAKTEETLPQSEPSSHA
tara:strand:- start:254 stop:544 length:291 start_codon:yes stop_codon:yes gene_type:complete